MAGFDRPVRRVLRKRIGRSIACRSTSTTARGTGIRADEEVLGPAARGLPHLRRTIEKLVSAPAIQFKGTGWYVTDYARKSTGGEAAGNKDAGSKDPGSKEAGSKEAGSKDKGTSGSSDTSKATSSSLSPSESKTASSSKDSPKK